MIRWEGDHLAVELPGARGVFTTRRGGVSEGPYATLNLGDHVDDDPEAVAENRRRVAELAGRGWEAFRWARQVHGSEVAVHRTSTTWGHRPDSLTFDAQVVGGDAAAIVFVADCLPVLFSDGERVAAVHAGWRGLAGGVLEAALEHLSGEVHAALGPSARGCCYEVGEEVHEALPGARRGAGNLDLAVAARDRLEGVARVHDAGVCTMCSEPSLFFSHRRDGGVTGRQAGAVWRA